MLNNNYQGLPPLLNCLIATFTVHVKGVRRVALQNVKCPERWLQVKDDELSGNGTGDEHCHFNLSEHGVLFMITHMTLYIII